MFGISGIDIAYSKPSLQLEQFRLAAYFFPLDIIRIRLSLFHDLDHKQVILPIRRLYFLELTYGIAYAVFSLYAV